MVRCALESPDQPEVAQLVRALDAYQDGLYPPECRYALDLTAVATDAMRFAVARDAQGLALGCGALVLASEHGEVKRMWVQPEARGQGVARALLALLEAEARAAGCPSLVLETGPRQPEAIALYTRHGFAPGGAFGSYREDPMSVFMHKPLRPAG